MRLRRRDWLSKSNCVHVRYGLAVSLDKFDLAGFKKDIARLGHSARSTQEGKTFMAVAPTHDSSRADYHVHFYCHWTERDFHATIEYFRGSERSERGDRGPFAEDIIAWLGQFIKNERATAQVTAAFIYSGKKWTPSLPLPMRIPLGLPREAEIVGMVANIPTKPEGVHETFVSLNDHRIFVGLEAKRPVRFRRFDLHNDVVPLSSVARLFAREIKK